MQPDLAQATRLIKAGCVDSIAGDLTRPALLWRLFASQAAKPPGSLPIPPEYSFNQQLAHELELFGFPLSGHPLDLFAHTLATTPHVSAQDLPRYVGHTVTLAGWLLTEKLIATKKGEPMEFLTLEDQTALYDATLFPDVYRRVCHLLAPNQAYVVTGVVEEQCSAITLTVTALRRLLAHDLDSQCEPIEEVAR